MNFRHSLPSNIQIITDRQSFIAELCRGKDVLHLGCVDSGLMDEAIEKDNFLQAKIAKVANTVIGVDNDVEGIAFLEKRKNDSEKFYSLDIEKINADTIKEKIDIVIAGEILEHLSNVGNFLKGMRELLLRHKAKMVVTVPNAYSIRHIKAVETGREIVHPDHNYYFSYVTIKALLQKFLLTATDIYLYNTPFSEIKGFSYTSIVELLNRYDIRRRIKRSPFLSEGLIFIVEPVLNENTACQ